jgi:hypothetical protein
MKINTLAMAAFLGVLMASCASTSTTTTDAPRAEKAASAAPKTTKSEKTKGQTQAFAATLSDTKAAAISALKLNGFEIKEESDTSITASRPRKIGLAVGSGGEKITVSLTAESDTSTKVSVETKKTFVGYAGQKNWDEPVLTAIGEKLS